MGEITSRNLLREAMQVALRKWGAFRVSEALREPFGALPNEVFAFRKRFGSHLELCPARFSRFGNASEDIWSFAKRGFRISEALREPFLAFAQEGVCVSGARRERFVVARKVSWGGRSQAGIY